MAYYTTADLAARHGLSIPAARYYLNQSGYSPLRTDFRSPRHTRVLSWPEPAARWLANRLAQRPIQPPPDPMRWLPFNTARAILGITRQRLNQLTAAGRIRSRRVLVKTSRGARWQAYCHAGDIETYPTTRQSITKSPPAVDMYSHLPVLLVRAWLLLLDIEQSQNLRCLAAYTLDAPAIQLMTATGQLHSLPTNAPESCPTLPATRETAASTDQWAEATQAMKQALGHLIHPEQPVLLSIAANAVTIWRREPGYPLVAEYPLPIPTAATA